MIESTTRPPDWLTLDEASTYVRTSKYVISSLIRAGVLKYEVRKGRKYVSKVSLDKFACLGGPSASWVKGVVWRNRPPRRQRSLQPDIDAHFKRLQELELMVRPAEKQPKDDDQ